MPYQHLLDAQSLLPHPKSRAVPETHLNSCNQFKKIFSCMIVSLSNMWVLNVYCLHSTGVSVQFWPTHSQILCQDQKENTKTETKRHVKNVPSQVLPGFVQKWKCQRKRRELEKEEQRTRGYRHNFSLCRLIENELVSVQPADKPRHASFPPHHRTGLSVPSSVSAASGFHHVINHSEEYTFPTYLSL